MKFLMQEDVIFRIVDNFVLIRNDILEESVNNLPINETTAAWYQRIEVGI